MRPFPREVWPKRLRYERNRQRRTAVQKPLCRLPEIPLEPGAQGVLLTVGGGRATLANFDSHWQLVNRGNALIDVFR